MPLLDIRHLTIEIDTPQGLVKAVDRMSLTMNEGEIRGLVGESGSGKSLVAKAIVGICKENWRVTADRMRLGNIDLLQLTPRERRRVIARDVAMIFQEPSTCLDPSEEVGRQLIESIPFRTFEDAGGSVSHGGKSRRLLCCTKSASKITKTSCLATLMS